MYNSAVERRNQRRNDGTKCLKGFVERYLLIHFHEKKIYVQLSRRREESEKKRWNESYLLESNKDEIISFMECILINSH